MDDINVRENGEFDIPIEFQCDKVVITTPYVKMIKNGRSRTMYQRDHRKEKPFIKDGLISLKKFGESEIFFRSVNKSGEQIFEKPIRENRDTIKEEK